MEKIKLDWIKFEIPHPDHMGGLWNIDIPPVAVLDVERIQRNNTSGNTSPGCKSRARPGYHTTVLPVTQLAFWERVGTINYNLKLENLVYIMETLGSGTVIRMEGETMIIGDAIFYGSSGLCYGTGEYADALDYLRITEYAILPDFE